MSAPACAVCNATGGGRFDVAQFDRAGNQKFATSVCSLTCLMNWAYRYASMQGAAFAFQAKSTLTSILDSLKGGKP